MSKGIVYILTNPCLDGWVKIGMTERNDVEGRLRELNTPTNIPLSYRCYAIYEVENPVEVEKRIHSLIDRVDNSLHAREEMSNGRIREREFFRISPETAFGIFKDVAALRGDRENLKIYAPTKEQAQEEEIADARTKKKNISFKLLGLNIGDELQYLFDENIVVTIVDEKNKIRYLEDEYSVTGLARILLHNLQGWAKNPNVNGWRYFVKDGVTLGELRDNAEHADD